MTRLLAALCAMALTLTACGDTDLPPASNNTANNGAAEDLGRDEGVQDMGQPDLAGSLLATVTVTPNPAALEIDNTLRLSVAAATASGGLYPTAGVVWSIDDDTIAEVTDVGVLIGKAGGVTTVRATLDGVEGTADVQVKGLPVARVEVRPATATLLLGDSSQLTVDLFDAQNAPLLDPRPTTFESSNTDIITVNAMGLVTAVTPGMGTVTVTVEGVTADAVFTVSGVVVDTVSVAPSNPSIFWGDTIQLTATLTYIGTPPATDPQITWTSTDDSVVEVDAFGNATGLKGGSAVITAIAGGKLMGTNVTVEDAFSQIAVGDSHVCGLIQGRAVCWGEPANGRLGHTGGSEPTRVATTLTFQTIAAGGRHTCGIVETTGAVHCWGDDAQGQLGNGTGASSNVPVAINLAANSGFTDLSLGDEHTCAAKSGQLYCWGNGAGGRLGTGNNTTAQSPVVIGGFGNPGAGVSHTCAINSSDVASCWGENPDGRLGNNSFVGSSSPVTVLGGFEYASVHAGAAHTCGVTTGNALTCWGSNDRNQVGDGADTNRATPILASATSALTRISTGYEHTCGLSGPGELFCWGAFDRGALAQTATADVDTPTASSSTLRFFAIGSGNSFSCGLATGGIPYCWGAGTEGQLGGSTDSATPVRVAPF